MILAEIVCLFYYHANDDRKWKHSDSPWDKEKYCYGETQVKMKLANLQF